MEDCPRWSWSVKKYGIREFSELFYDQLPMIVKIEESSNDDDDEDEKTPQITQSVCCIHSVHLQPRVVTRTTDQQYISIPTKYPFRFHTIDCDGSSANEPQTMAQLLTGHSPDPKGLRIQIAEADQLSLSEEIECDLFGPLIMTGTYSEKYLLVSRLDFRDVSVTTLATYLPLEISVLNTTADREDFEEFQKKVFASIATPKYEENPEELLIFSHPPNDDDYEIILPSNLTMLADPEFRESKRMTKVSHAAKETNSIQPPILPARSILVERPIIGQTAVSVSTDINRQNQLRLNQDIRHHKHLNICKSVGLPARATGEKEEEIYGDFVPRFSRTRTPDGHAATKNKTRSTELDHWFPLESEMAPNPCVNGSFGSSSSHKASKKTSYTKKVRRRIESEQDSKLLNCRSSSDKTRLLKSDSSSQLVNCPDLSNEEHVLNETPTSSELPFRDSRKERICKKQKNTAAQGQFTSNILGLSWSMFKPFKKRCSSSEKSKLSETGRQKSGSLCDAATRFGAELDSTAEEDAIKNNNNNNTTRSLTERASSTITSNDREESGTSNPSVTCKGHDLSANRLAVLPFEAVSANEPSDNSTRRKKKILDNVTNYCQGGESKSVKPPSSHTIKIRQESIVRLSDVPLDITMLSVGDIARCLSLLNLDQYVQLFQENQVDGVLLGCLDEDVLTQDFGLKRFDAIKLSKFARKGWRPKVEGI